ncbi:hypothetical protein [Hymenobacter metallilatus]|uniref:Uncharacterized protein n=1 Tax=Hymenobacter metallilatus TaxID=2493666 RepID=A0A3R9LX31_9BACT|nr:hypothetical protein [Hymenobacter metallilatus]RSK30127.1 hypothetical protein EI290_14830 [Hymenobacter metallilatus]
MADINIQRKKNTPSPWLILLLVLAVVGIGAYFLFRAETAPPTDVPAPAGSGIPAPPDSTTGAETGPRPSVDAVGDMATEESTPVTAEVLTAFAQGDASQPTFGREGLRLLTSALVDLADRDDLRDATIRSRRDDLTSATSRLSEAGTSLRPGYVAAALLVQAIQQKAYPELAPAAQQLTTLADNLSGRSSTAQEQQQVKDYFTTAAQLVKALNEPPQ